MLQKDRPFRRVIAGEQSGGEIRCPVDETVAGIRLCISTMPRMTGQAMPSALQQEKGGGSGRCAACVTCARDQGEICAGDDIAGARAGAGRSRLS